jgi:hypothetical protein
VNSTELYSRFCGVDIAEALKANRRARHMSEQGADAQHLRIHRRI